MCGTWPTFITKYGVIGGSSSACPSLCRLSATQCVLCVWMTQRVCGSLAAAAA